MQPDDNLFYDDEIDPEEDTRLAQQTTKKEPTFRRLTPDEFLAKTRREMDQYGHLGLPTDEEQMAEIELALQPENQQRIQETIHGAVETRKPGV